MTRTTWRSICHARAVTPIAVSLVRQSMDLLGRSIRAGAFREIEILTARTGMRKMIFRELDEYFAYVPKTGDGKRERSLCSNV